MHHAVYPLYAAYVAHTAILSRLSVRTALHFLRNNPEPVDYSNDPEYISDIGALEADDYVVKTLSATAGR